MRRWTIRGETRHKLRVIELILLLLAIVTGGPATATALDRVTIGDDGLVLEFDGPVGNATAFVLAGPQRIAIDIAGAEPGRPVAADDAAIDRIRQGRNAAGGLRLVFDLSRPLVPGQGGFSPDGRRLTIGLLVAQDSEFAAAVRAGMRLIPSPVTALDPAPGFAMARPASRRYQVSVPIGRARPGPALPTVMGPADRALPLVVIDAGHSGHDPGALSPDRRHRESDVTLAIAKQVRDALVQSGRVRVALTRDTDRFLVLEERYGIARRLGADLFISIHADAAENTSASGASIYTLSEVASDREASRLAARENRANILNGMDLGGRSADVRSILIDLTQRETMNLSSDFARTLQRSAGGDIPFHSDSHRFAGFVVLKAPDMPSVLLETGFITNPADAARIAGDDGQRAIARGLREAVLRHFARQIAARGSAAGGSAAGADRLRLCAPDDSALACTISAPFATIRPLSTPHLAAVASRRLLKAWSQTTSAIAR